LAKTKRRGYPTDGTALEDRKYGKRGNARGKNTRSAKGDGPQRKLTTAERRRR
jgi:hypothetical protein